HEHDHFGQTGSVERRGVFAPGGFPGIEDPECPGHVGRQTGAGAFGETVKLEHSHRAWLRVSFSLPNHRVVVNCSRKPATRSRSSHRRSKKFRMTGSRFVN